MLAHAVQLAKAGRAVYIIAANAREEERLQRLVPEGLGITVETDSCDLDWTTMALPGAHPNCIVLADHYAIESRFAKMLDMLTRYDTP